MRLKLTAALAASAAMVVSTLPLAGAASATELVASPGDGDGTTSAATAQETLAAVRAAFAPKPTSSRARAQALADGREVTLLLRDLRAQVDELPVDQKRVARGYLSRPYGGEAFPGEPTYDLPEADPTRNCSLSDNFCIHWARATGDAPNLEDRDQDGIPDYVEQVAATMDHVYKRVVTRGGYRAPRADAVTNPQAWNPNGKTDIFLANLGPAGLYGYCTSDDPADSFQISAYCVLDDDYAAREFPTNTPLENLQVTAAHEFFHAVQYAYDWSEDGWMLEGLAAWVEDEIYDGVNDNLQYLRESPLTQPHEPLDNAAGLAIYGSWIWWRYMSERWPGESDTGLPVVIRSVLEKAGGSAPGKRGTYSIDAVKRVLASKRTSLPKTLSAFGVANRTPGKFYSEGSAYPRAPLAYGRTLKPGKPRSALRITSDHLENTTLRYRPASSMTAKAWKLRVKVDTPPRKNGHGVTIAVVKKNGNIQRSWMTLTKDGTGKKSVAFSRRTVRYVEITVTNGSSRFNCWEGTAWSCQGLPKDDNARTRTDVTAFR